MSINNQDINATRLQWNTPPVMQIDTKKKYSATFDTNLGVFKAELFASEAPITVNNFVFLARNKFYNNVVFHRVIKNFMIQSGDPTGTGCGGPGYRFADELPAKHPYEPGIVAMANAGPNTNGSQFFVCTGADARYLDRQPNYTQFGKISDGMDVVLKIASVPVVFANGEMSSPQAPPIINNVSISES